MCTVTAYVPAEGMICTICVVMFLIHIAVIVLSRFVTAYSHIFMLFIFTAQCEASEYYVRPTESGSSVLCPPSHTCLTINQYTDPSNDYLRQNNTVFTFLPGKHFMMRSMEFNSVENITLRASGNSTDMYPELVPSFPCHKRETPVPSYGNLSLCSAIEVSEVVNAVISGLTTETALNISGIVIKWCSNVHISQSTFYSNTSITFGTSVTDRRGAGIVIDESSNVRIQSVHTRNVTTGVLMWRVSNVTVQDSQFQSSFYHGIFAHTSINISLLNLTSNYSVFNGILLVDVRHSLLQGVIALRSIYSYGIFIQRHTDTKMTDIISSLNNLKGISVWSSTATTMINVSTPYNHEDGVHIYGCRGTSIKNAISMYNLNNGIYVESSTGTVMMNVLSRENQNYGVYINNCIGIKMMDVSLINNYYFGIGVKQSTGASMTNILPTRNDDGAMPSSVVFLQKCSNIQIANISISGNNHKLFFLDSTDVLLEESTFSHIASTLQQLTTDLPSIITLYNAHLILRNCKFAFNSVTSVAAISSNITLEENVSFENNSAVSAAAFIFSRSSVLILSEQCNTVFRNNSVSLHGAVFYIVTEREPVTVGQLVTTAQRFSNDIASGTRCFVQVEGDRSHSPRLTFINNTAGEGGDVLYGGLVAAGYDGDWNCLLSFKNMSDTTAQSCERRITSAPSRVCSCHDHSSPDCLVVVDPTTHTLYPGQTLTVSAAVVGQDFGIVSGDVYAQFMDSENSSVQSDQKRLSYRINDGCAKLNYKVISSCENYEAVLVLTSDEREVSQLLDSVDNQKLNRSWSILQSEPDYRKLLLEYTQKLLSVENRVIHSSEQYYDILDSVIDDFFTICPAQLYFQYIQESGIVDFIITEIYNKLIFPQEIYTYPLYINVEFLSCPLGFTLSQSQCDCDQLLRHMPTVQCDIERQSITRAGSVWVGVDGNNTLVASQYCPLNYCKDESIQVTLQDNSTTGPDSQCNYRHSGVLCGGCQPGLSLALGSEQCLHCSNAYISLVLPFALAGLVLVLFIKVLDFTVCQGTINGFIFYANIINANKQLYYNQSDVNPITLFISWFNLDFGG